MRGNPYLFAGPIILLLAVTVFAHRHREQAAPPSVYLIEAYLERDSTSGEVIAFSTEENQVTVEAVEETIAQIRSEEAPDAIFRCDLPFAHHETPMRVLGCEVVHSNAAWRAEEPSFREAYGLPPL